MSARPTTFGSIEEIVNLVQQYEGGTLPRKRWDHSAYLAVAAWYLTNHKECDATEAFITGVLRYNRAWGIEASDAGGYNETVTLFWLTAVHRFLSASDPGASLLQVTNDLIAKYGERPRFFLEYFSKELIESWRALQSWVDPDLKPIERGLQRCRPRANTNSP